MRDEWLRALSTNSRVLAPSGDRQIKQVLLEYDGPQMVVLSAAEGERLALAVDEDDVVVRWLEAPISHLELSALLDGAQPIREVFKKPGLSVVDYPHEFESPLSMWRLDDWTDVPDAVLPVRGVYLPMTPRRDATQTVPLVRVSGHGAAKDGATLPQLAAAIGTLHETFTSIVQNIMGILNPPPFSAFAATHGSLAFHIHSDDAALFESVISSYETLVRASQRTPEDLGRALAVMPPPVVKIYEKHLNALEKQGVEVLATWRGGSVFLGRGTAESALESYPDTDATPIQIVTRQHRGYFAGFWPLGRRWRFSFYDIDANDNFTGKIGKEIKTDWARDLTRDPVLVGSPQQKYLIDAAEQEDAAGVVLDRALVAFQRID